METQLLLTASELERRLREWAEVTALSLELLDASIAREFPALSEDERHQKLIERLHAFRQLRV